LEPARASDVAAELGGDAAFINAETETSGAEGVGLLPRRRAYDLLAEGLGPGFNAPLLLVADLRSPGVDAQAIPALSERIAADPGIAMIGEPQTSPATART
jgi:hypothetical protein